MTYTDTKVYKFLKNLETYLKGDLETFHRVCKEVEEKENKEDAESGYFGTSGGDFLDLDRIIRQNHFRSTIPHALLLFSTIDLLGYLLCEVTLHEKPKHYQAEAKFEKFFGVNLSALYRKVLIGVFRNGISHNYFPKSDMIIAYHSKLRDEKLFLKKDLRVVLNVNCIEQCVIKRLDDILLGNEDFTKMDLQYDKLVKDYDDNHKADIDEIREGL